jgi:putative tryptophan/tyrosine transport system substrate-binding protein
MRRLVSILLALVGSSVAAQDLPHKIGFVSGASSSSMASRVEAFRHALRELGYVEGQNITIEYRWGNGSDERLHDLTADLVRVNVSMIVSHGVLATLAARAASSTIPILCFSCGDLVATGVVENLRRPGGNITGLTVFAPEMSGKRLELLKEFFPGLMRVAVLYNSSNPVSQPELQSTHAAAVALGLQVDSVGVKDSTEFENAFLSIRSTRADAVMVLSDSMLFGGRKQIAQLAVANRLPAISWSGDFARAGGLVGYGPDVLAIARHAAPYVAKILKGVKAGDLPVEQPTKFELVLNLKTAKALGLAIPPTLLARADEVIE